MREAYGERCVSMRPVLFEWRAILGVGTQAYVYHSIFFLCRLFCYKMIPPFLSPA